MERRSGFWNNAATMKLFDAICAKSMISIVDWNRFKELDKKGVFSEIKNSHLSLVYLKRVRAASHLCVYCGLVKVAEGTSLCDDCKEKYKQLAKKSEKTVAKVTVKPKTTKAVLTPPDIEDDIEIGEPTDD